MYPRMYPFAVEIEGILEAASLAVLIPTIGCACATIYYPDDHYVTVYDALKLKTTWPVDSEAAR